VANAKRVHILLAARRLLRAHLVPQANIAQALDFHLQTAIVRRARIPQAAPKRCHVRLHELDAYVFVTL
jgi:hypothetical protein